MKGKRRKKETVRRWYDEKQKELNWTGFLLKKFLSFPIQIFGGEAGMPFKQLTIGIFLRKSEMCRTIQLEF